MSFRIFPRNLIHERLIRALSPGKRFAVRIKIMQFRGFVLRWKTQRVFIREREEDRNLEYLISNL